MGAMVKKIQLYHFTSLSHVPLIERDGFLKTTESNISEHRQHAGPDVVWLTTNPDPDYHRGTWEIGSNVDKLQVRFTVLIATKSVFKWRPWAGSRGIDQSWAEVLARVGGWNSWRVVERNVPRDEWVKIDFLTSGSQTVQYRPELSSKP